MSQHVPPAKPALSQPQPEGATLSPWDAFVSAKTAESFCRAWLGILCQQVVATRAAAVLVEDPDSHSFVPIAVWPQASPELSRLSGVVEVCLRKHKPVIQPAPGAHVTELAYPVMIGQRIISLVVLESAGTELEVQAAMRQMHWSSAWLSNLLTGRELEQALQNSERTSSVLNCTAIALRHDNLRQALFEVANIVSQRFGCSKVAIGLVHHAHVRLAALSETASFEKNTSLSKAYVAAMEEAQDIGKLVQLSKAVPDIKDEKSPPARMSDILPLHTRLVAQSGASTVLSCPLIQGATIVGVLTLERKDSEGFDAAECAWLDAFAAVVAPIILQRQDAEHGSLRRMLIEGRRVLVKLFGPRHLIWKASATFMVLLIAIFSLVHINYQVTAKTVIEGEVQRVIAAPFAGFIQAGYVRAGDTVHKGQALASLDDRELKIERVRWASERDQYENKLREAVAVHNLTDVQVVGAQLRQSEAQLALIVDKINRASLTAPYDGIVVAGDLSQQIGAPIELGKELFTIAPLQSYRVILQVDEQEIRHVRTEQQGRLVIMGIASDPIPLTISKVTPIATSQDGKNFFRVEARLAHSSVHLRPGMEGVGKIETGQQQLWWILTHSLTNWLSLMAWKWLP